MTSEITTQVRNDPLLFKDPLPSKLLPHFCGVLFVVLLVPLLKLGQIGSSTEAREVHVARLMYETGNWILPLRNDLVPSKPPMYHWTVAALGEAIGGVDEFAARLVSLLYAGCIIALSCYLAQHIAFHLYRQREQADLVGLLTSLVLGSSYQFLNLAGQARVDMAFAFFVVLAITVIFVSLSEYCEAKGSRIDLIDSKSFLYFYIACAGAVLSKGPLGMVLPLALALVATIYTAGVKKSLLIWLKPRFSWLIFLIIAGSWYYLAYLQAGEAFIKRQVFFENLERFVGGEKITVKPWWFYLPAVLAETFPWALIAVWLSLKELKRSKLNIFAPYPHCSTCRCKNITMLWFVLGVILLSLSSGKRTAYLLPLLPGLSIYVAIHLAVIKENKVFKVFRKFEPFLTTIFIILIGGLSILGILLNTQLDVLSYVTQFLSSFNLQSQKVTQGVLEMITYWIQAHSSFFILCLITFILVRILLKTIKNNHTFLILNLWATLLLSVSFCVYSGFGIKNLLKDYRGAAYAINNLTPIDAPMLAVRYKANELMDPLLYYLKREVPVVEPPIISLICGTYYLAQLTDFQEALKQAKEQNLHLELKAKISQPIDMLNEDNDRDIFLYYCNCSARS